MSELSRRQAFQILASGAALAGGAAAASSASASPSAGTAAAPPRPSEQVLEAVLRACRQGAAAVQREEPNPIRAGRVLACRSWDRQVYLYLDEATRGFVPVSEHGYAIASSCQAADRPVWVQYWGHEALAGGGVGAFAGAHLAFEADELPSAADRDPS